MKKGQHKKKTMEDSSLPKSHTKKIRTRRPFGKAAMFILVFAALGVFALIKSFAATPTAHFETEQANLTSCAAPIADANASSGQAVKFGCSVSGFVHPGVVYSQAEIDAWSTSDPDYTSLANTGAGKAHTVTDTASKYYPKNYGIRIDSGGNANCSAASGTPCELNDGLKDQSGFAKVQAVLWAADGIQARKDRVIAYLNGFRQVTSYEWDNVEQYRLVSGWGCTNLAQAAEIVDYHDSGFETFLRKCYDIMDWPTNPNWHASFADSKLAIAAYLGDSSLWSDAKAYFYERIGQSIYHASYDNGFVKPMHSEDNVTGSGTSSSTVPKTLHAPPGTIHASRTVSHWGGATSCPQVATDLKAEYPVGTPMPNGTNAERRRDLGHVNMGLSGWMHAMRTLKVQGESGSKYDEAYARLLAGYSYHSQRVLSYAQTSTYPSPAPCNGAGGASRFMGYYGAKKLFGANTPASVTNMLARTEVNTTYATAVSNHNVAEKFSDE